MLAVNVAANLVLIPRLAELGAAIASCFAMFIGLVVGWCLSQRVFHLPIPWAETAKLLISAGVMCLGLQPIARFSGTPALICQIAVGAALYCVVLVLLNVLGMRNWLAQTTLRRVKEFIGPQISTEL